MNIIIIIQPSGGGVATFILVAFFNYNSKKAIQITFLIMFSGALGNFAGNAVQRTPQNQPLVHYKLAALSVPVMMSGALFGVMVNHFLPESLILLMLISIILKTSSSIYKKFTSLVQKENNELLLEREQQE